MATIVNNPQPTAADGTGSGGLVAGIVIALIVVLLFLFVALPAMRNSGTGTNTNTPGSTTNIEVPERMDVNVQGQ